MFGKMRPPPRHSGEDVIPARARPVPFCLKGFLVECLTCSRSFWARVPWRALAWIGHHDLVNQVFVVLTTEHGFGRVELRSGLTLVVQEFELHQFAPFAGFGLDGRAHGHEAASADQALHP